MSLPNLAGVATQDLVEQIGGSFKASYINWSRTLHLLREHAPGWLPEIVHAADGSVLHSAPVGCYMLIRFRNGEQVTPAVPQAVMDTRNAAIPRDKVTARDLTDTHRRGVCMAAAFTFGLAYELWAKMPLESGHHPDDAKVERIDGLTQERAEELESMAADMLALQEEGRAMAAVEAYYSLPTNEEKLCLWGFLKGSGGGSTPESRLRALIKANKPNADAAAQDAA